MILFRALAVLQCAIGLLLAISSGIGLFHSNLRAPELQVIANGIFLTMGALLATFSYFTWRDARRDGKDDDHA